MDIGEILSSLSEDDMQNLQAVASSILGNMSAPRPPVPPNPASTKNNMGDITALLTTISKSENDPRCQLIAALKPMLSEERRKKADDAIKIIKLTDTLPALRDSGLLKGVFG